MQFSKRITADTQDVLAGSVVGILPTNAPSNDVEVRVAAYDPSNATEAGDAATVTLLVNGVAVMQGSRSYTVNQGGNSEPRSDAPLASFTAPGGSRLTLNIDLAAGTNASVYVEALESTAGTGIGATHVGRKELAANSAEQDVLAGTVVAQVPSTGMHTVSMMLSSSNTGGQATVLIDSDTVCEGFEIPYRTETLAEAAIERDQFGVEDRDTVITVLATAGSAVTLNLASGSNAVNIVYAVSIDPA